MIQTSDQADGIRVAMAQLNVTVGDISGNRDLILDAMRTARDELGADVLLTSELALTGYPPEDLVLRPGFMKRTHDVVAEMIAEVSGIDLVLGHPWQENDSLYNSVSWIRNGLLLGRYHKQCLPNYAIFDEKRYFSAGHDSLVIDVKGCRCAVVICEDCWEPGPIRQALQAGAHLLLTPNASPCRRGKHLRRLQTLGERIHETRLPMAYCNQVGGQDELLFDGRSLFLADQHPTLCAAHCEAGLVCADFAAATSSWQQVAGVADCAEADLEENETAVHEQSQDLNEVYQALQLGLQDYLHKNGFSRCVIGLSGGIDSALCYALLVDGIGADNVIAVALPSQHTSQLSLDLALEQVQLAGGKLHTIPIARLHDDAVALLAENYRPIAGLADQNIQARARGILLMAISNDSGAMLVATGNKSELATGYCTIYGDMCGGFSPLKDVSKTLVYQLCAWRNQQSRAIPQGVIERAPSAELAPDQRDDDSLPPYDRLDRIMEHYVEQDWSIADIVAAGFDEAEVRQIAGLVLQNEYKRRQGAPGIRITARAFGRDRRYPITSGWKDSGEISSSN
jgi:NAD+ synthase (glutamine-hydrolysing)